MSAESHHERLERVAGRLAVAWSLFLPGGLAGWWILVLVVPGSAWWFSPESLGWNALLAFGLPDLVLLTVPSLVVARLLLRGERTRAQTWLWWIAGAQGYATLWSVVASLITWQAWAGPALMLFVWFMTLNIAWTNQPSRRWFIEAGAERTALTNVRNTVVHAVFFDAVFLVLLPALVLLGEHEIGLPPMHGVDLLWPMIALIVPLNLLVGLGSGVVMALRGDGTPLPIETASTLVVSGPYAHVRNPMAAVGILQGVLLAVGLASWGVLLYALAGGLIWHVFVRPIEEIDLEHRFGEAYHRYRDSVPLWLPRLLPWRPPEGGAPSDPR